MTYMIRTRDPVSDDPADGYEWRDYVTAEDEEERDMHMMRLTHLGYTEPDSLRAELVEDAKGAKA